MEMEIEYMHAVTKYIYRCHSTTKLIRPYAIQKQYIHIVVKQYLTVNLYGMVWHGMAWNYTLLFYKQKREMKYHKNLKSPKVEL